MFIRAVRASRGKLEPSCFSHQLVESLRTEKGPRQRLIMHLGTLDLPKPRWRELAAAGQRHMELPMAVSYFSPSDR